jgi:Dipeptidyl aminopeptidases/acylaminoacyl-peptidases
MISSYKSGVIAAGENHVEIQPKTQPAVQLPGVLHVHGAGGSALTALQWYDNGKPHASNTLADAGYTSVSADLGGPQTWGNSVATNLITTAKNYLQTLPHVKPGKVVLYGQSAGGLAALNWAAANPTLVSCIVMVVPVINLTDIKVNNRTGYAALVDAAYGGAYSEAVHGATRNPKTMASAGKFAGIPILIHYGLTDTTCIPSETEAFATIVGENVDMVSHPTGHDMTTYGDVDNVALVDWITANAL